MNDLELDPVFSAGFRAALVDDVARRAAPRRRRRLWFGAAFVGVLLATGAGGVATATLNAPPGATVHEQLGESVTATFAGAGTLTLDAPPAEANSISFAATCLRAGAFWVENYGGMACAPDEVGQVKRGAVDLSLWQQSTLEVDPDAGVEVSITAAYSKAVQTEWGTNRAGETYGADRNNISADLSPATATNGNRGYIRNTELTDATIDPTSTTREELDEYIAVTGRPDRYIPVYESDGVTVIGDFLIVGFDTQERIAQEMRDAGIPAPTWPPLPPPAVE